MLKNKLIALLVSVGMCLACAPGMADGQAFEVLTSFYPMYLLTVNVAGGIDGVNVKNMAEQNVGCLHDYTLRTGDMRMIHAADVVVINGAGMESFTDKILTDQQKPVIVASEGIDLICDDDEDESRWPRSRRRKRARMDVAQTGDKAGRKHRRGAY